MNELLERAIMAHGSLERFDQFTTVSASVLAGGMLWHMKGQGSVSGDMLRVTVDLHRECAVLVPFKLPNQRAVFTSERVAIENSAGEIIAERINPRAAFAGHMRETPWDDLHLIYFVGYALWSYLTLPFSLLPFGCEVAEIEPWQEQEEIWRCLKVTFPSQIATHSTEQTLYFGVDGLLRRHDYAVEIMGNVPIAHYVSEYENVSGILLPTKRRAFVRRPDNRPASGLLSVSIDLSELCFE